MKNPLVSVIAICYNHEGFVDESLDSIRLQSYSNLEVLIIDSNSSDNSVEKIENYIKKFNLVSWQFVKNIKSKTICENLNFALNQIKGDFYQIISCDDIILTCKIESQINILSSEDFKFDLIYGNYSHINELGEVIKGEEIQLNKNGFSELKEPPSGKIFCDILGTWYIHSITCLISRKASLQIGGYDENLVYEDTDFLLRFSRAFLIKGDLGLVGSYRILANSFFRSRSVEFYISTCHLYYKHLDKNLPCYYKVRRLLTHYLDVVFQMDSKKALDLYKTCSAYNFDSYLPIYFNTFILTKSLKFSLFTKGLAKKILS
jgi:glycosyltransferase involved in cell wall biosynthesis